ncbi:hypothetical protein NW768_008419 [Fusarium equiseti]|uniref:Uncharacterized protein n=1 Tax=Fusarium equiseti TaxID=61235 RepID=A0ABQ8R6Z5_FUSEQ|nr:hypothetical protein NW768_008419 [Fusarium equiseti]
MSQSIDSKNDGPVAVAAASATNPVQIVLTPPTPIISTTANTIDRRGEDTHKEVHRLPDVSEEKQVVEKTDFSDEKQVYDGNTTRDDKEVYVVDVGKEVYDAGVEKEVHNLTLHDGHDEKQLYNPNNQNGQYEPEKEVVQPDGSPIQYSNTTPDDRRASVSSTSTGSKSQNKFCYKRHVNKFNEAIDKKNKAWADFINNSTEKMDNSRRVFEESTMAKMSALDRSISDGVDRAGKGYNSTITSWKTGMANKKAQSVSSMKSLGSKYQIGGKCKEAKEEKATKEGQL